MLQELTLSNVSGHAWRSIRLGIMCVGTIARRFRLSCADNTSAAIMWMMIDDDDLSPKKGM